MVIGSADLHQSIRNAWFTSGLDDVFRSYWSPTEQTQYISLNEDEAAPKQPFPFCVYEASPGSITDRMTGHTSTEKHIIRDIPVSFSIFTKPVYNYSAKKFASILMESLLSKFGGHPTDRPIQFDAMENGSVLLVQYQNDYSIRAGDEEYEWVVEYLFRTDVPLRT